jgi:hypothetical protein
VNKVQRKRKWDISRRGLSVPVLASERPLGDPLHLIGDGFTVGPPLFRPLYQENLPKIRLFESTKSTKCTKIYLPYFRTSRVEPKVGLFGGGNKAGATVLILEDVVFWAGLDVHEANLLNGLGHLERLSWECPLGSVIGFQRPCRV